MDALESVTAKLLPDSLRDCAAILDLQSVFWDLETVVFGLHCFRANDQLGNPLRPYVKICKHILVDLRSSARLVDGDLVCLMSLLKVFYSFDFSWKHLMLFRDLWPQNLFTVHWQLVRLHFMGCNKLASFNQMCGFLGLLHTFRQDFAHFFKPFSFKPCLHS